MMGKVSLYGKLGYTQHYHHRQSWNSMTGTYWEGVNLCDSMPGNQQAGTYDLRGAFALSLHRHWVVGAQFDYQVQQTAKDIDPRNRNQWMAWTLTPGIGYRANYFRLGASLRYASRKESVDIRNMGTHNTYPIFTTYPLAFFRTLPQEDNPAWHYTGQEIGGALQLETGGKPFRLFQQLSAHTLHQSTQSNRVQNRSEGETDGWQATYRATVQRQLAYTRHEWTCQAMIYHADSYDPLQRQDVNGPWQSYGRVLRSTRAVTEGEATYRFDASAARFFLLAELHYRQAESTLLFYPVAFSQFTRRFALYTMLNRDFVLPRKSLLSLALGGYYGKGTGTLLHEKQLPDGESSPDIRLWQNAVLRQQAFDYETVARWSLQASVAYTRPLPHTTLSWFTRLTGEYEQAGYPMQPADRGEITAGIGLLF